MSLDSTKSNGPDGISAKMLKGVAGSVTPVLVHLFNLSISNATVPSTWKASRIVPIPKDSTQNPTPSNFRPISLLSVTSKLLERVIYSRIQSFVETTHPVAANQWGFLPGKSTTHVLVYAVHVIDWLSTFEQGHEIGAVFFDLTKAFDKVPHKQLVSKLKEIGLNNHLMSWISSYLMNRMPYHLSK